MRKRFLTAVALLLLCALALSSCAAPEAPTIGENGNWYIEGTDTGVSAKGENGKTPTIEISEYGFWIINGKDTEFMATAEDGLTPEITLNSSGYWVINGRTTKISALGQKGADGTSPAVVSCVKTSTSDDGLVDTYTITFSDGSYTTFDVDKIVDVLLSIKNAEYTKEGNNASIFNVTFTDNSSFGITVSHDSEAKQAFDSAVTAGYADTFGNFVLTAINAVIDTYGDSSFFTEEELVTLAMPTMLNNWNTYFSTESNGAPVINVNVTTSTINTLIANKGTSNSGNMNATSNMVISTVLGSGSVLAKADTLAAGDYLTLDENHIINNKQLTLSFKINELTGSDLIRLGHGETEYASAYMELTATHVKVYEYYNGAVLRHELEHGLTLKDYVNITIDVGYNSARITVASASGVYQSGSIGNWSGRQGVIYAVSQKSALTDVKMRWSSSEYSEKIWLLGDSYFNDTDLARWTSYLIKDGYTNNFMSGFPGRNSASALIDFKRALEHGTPVYAVWCMGMNDKDSDTAINASYLAATEEFLRICSEKGITPILTTTPCTPTNNNSFKNEWVKASGYRYIDFAKAVGGEDVGSSWYDGMLYDDEVHPNILGAQALYAQFLVDFPEIMKKD